MYYCALGGRASARRPMLLNGMATKACMAKAGEIAYRGKGAVSLDASCENMLTPTPLVEVVAR